MELPEFLLPDWPALPQVHAATSTRVGGVSHFEYASFNLAGHVGDQADRVATNREILQQVLCMPEQPVWLNQVHGIDVLKRESQDHRGISHPATFDACYTCQPQVVCAVLTADCLPVLFCSRDGQEVAAAHAGWRGLVDGILPATVAAFSAVPGDVLAWLGPAIGPDSFEVGEDVYVRFVEQWRPLGQLAVAACFRPGRPHHWWCDLYALARLQLKSLGVTSIWGGGEDTFTNWQRYYSYRRDGDTGRMVSLIWRTG